MKNEIQQSSHGQASEQSVRLCVAASRGDFDSAVGAVEHGADPAQWLSQSQWQLLRPKEADFLDIFPFMPAALLASYSGHARILKLLLAAGADPQPVHLEGNIFELSALALACSFGNPECVGLLLAAGADPNFSSPDGRRPLGLAAARGCVDSVRMLLGAGAWVDAADGEGETPLMGACMHPNGAQCMRALLEAGADPFFIDAQGMSARDRALDAATEHPSIQGRIPELESWMRAGAVKVALSEHVGEQAHHRAGKGASRI